jgi:glycosyltransferase involved in cell wall biosynthesis
MKVLLVHNEYQQHGGEHVAVQQHEALLLARGHTVIRYLRDNADIDPYPIWRGVQLALSTVYNPRVYREIRAIVDGQRPDLAHVHNVFPMISPAVYRALHDSGVPVVQTLHNYRFLCPNGLFYRQNRICECCSHGNTLPAVLHACFRDSRVQSACYAASIAWNRAVGNLSRAERYIALTDFAANKFVESGLLDREQLRVLPNYVPEAEIGLAQNDVARGEPYFLYMGRLSPEKGVRCLVEAAEGLEGPTIVIAGDGPDYALLRGLAAAKSHSRIEFVGRVTGAAKWALLRGATASVVTSVCYENLPFGAIESLLVGTPVVASAVGGLPSIISDGETGLLFRPGDVGDLRAKLRWLVSHGPAAQSMRGAARAHATRHYSADAHYRGLMQIYTEVTACA